LAMTDEDTDNAECFAAENCTTLGQQKLLMRHNFEIL